MFQGSLPPHIIAALASILDLEAEDAGQLEASLLQIAGEGAPEVLHELEATA